MRRLISTHVFRHRRLTTAHLDRLQRAGVEAVELFCARGSFDYRNRAQVDEIAAWFGANPMRVHSLHSPIYFDEHDGKSGEPPVNIADVEPRLRLQAMDEILRALDFADRMPVRYLVQHIGPSRDEWSQRKSDNALTSLERLRVHAKQAGVCLLVENIPNGLSTPERLAAFLQQNHLDIGVCFDAGHAHMAAELFGGGGVGASWDHLGSYVLSTHLHDNTGRSDDHLWPGSGSLPWKELMPRLAAAKAPGVAVPGDQGSGAAPADTLPWMLEVGDHDDVPDVADAIGKAFDHLEKSSRN